MQFNTISTKHNDLIRYVKTGSTSPKQKTGAYISCAGFFPAFLPNTQLGRRYMVQMND